MRYENPSTSSRGSNPSQQQDSFDEVIYDADDNDTRDEMSVPAKTDQELAHLINAIDEINLPYDIKADLKRKLLAGDEEKETDAVNYITSQMTKNITSDIFNESSMNKQKKDLGGNETRALNSGNLTESAEGQKHKLIKKTGSVISTLPVPEHIKKQFMGKLAAMAGKEPQSGDDSFAPPSIHQRRDASASPSYRSRNTQQQPITSTPKKGRRSWDESRNSSEISDIDFINSEIRNYWHENAKSIYDWIDTLPLNLDKDIKQAIKQGIGRDIRDRQKYLQLNPDATKTMQEELENLQYQVLRRLSKLLDKDDMKLVTAEADKLTESMKAIKLPKSKKAPVGDSTWRPTDNLQNLIIHWIDMLPIEYSIKNSDEFQILKEDLVSNLIKKLEAINNDRNVSNDDVLYEDMLLDEIEKLMNELPIDPDTILMEKEALIQQIMDNRRTSQSEIEGMAYKQQLKDVASKTLIDEDRSPEEQDTFEIMKDELANAFIRLHYTGDNKEQRKKLKNKINDEVKKYCNDYLKKHPTEVLNHTKLGEELYAALKKVPLPPNESMKLEEERMRHKDIVTEWVKDLPLEELTAAEHLGLTQNIDTLAKKLNDIERNAAQLSPSEINNAMQRVITNFLNNMPLKPGQEKNINNIANNLISKIRASESARRVNESTKYSIPLDDSLSSGMEEACPHDKFQQARQKPTPSNTSENRIYPPCSLSNEDREHLERIRQRACMTSDCLSPLLRGGKRNSYLSPKATESGSQTEQNVKAIGPRILFQPCVLVDQSNPIPCSEVPRRASKQKSTTQITRSQFVESGSQIDLQPQIVIREYYWDTADTSNVLAPESRQSSSSLQHQRFTVPSGQAVPCPGSKNQYRLSPQNRSFQICQDRGAGSSLPYVSSPYIPPPSAGGTQRAMPFSSSPYDPTPCSSRSCSPNAYTPKPCQGATSQFFMRHQQSSPQNSFGEYCSDYEYVSPKRNGLQSEQFGNGYSRKERVIKLGSLNDLRKPLQRQQSEDIAWSSHFPQDDFWGAQSNFEEEDFQVPCNMPRVREKREERLRCKCKERIMMNTGRRRPRAECLRDSNLMSNCPATKHCPTCFGPHCPYPSYMYFKQ